MNECSEGLKALKELKEKTQDKGVLRRLKTIEKELNAYETLLNVLFGPYVYNDGCGSNGWYLIGPTPGEKVEIPITEKDANVLIQAGIKERR